VRLPESVYKSEESEFTADSIARKSHGLISIIEPEAVKKS
jgi:hypothetical protein